MTERLLEIYRSNKREGNLLFFMILAFLAIFFMPAGTERFDNAVLEAFRLTNWYAQEHVILCLLPAFLIAGAMAVYISQGSVMRYLGPSASKPVAFSVASVSGTLLAVCSCTVLPLFGGIYRRGAGLGAAVAFLYSGPAINIMAIYNLKWPITAALGAALGVLLVWRWHWPPRQLLILAAAIAIAATLTPAMPELPFVIGIGGLMLIATMRDEDREWPLQSWDFAKQILPLLLAGVFVAGFALGRPGHEGMIPSAWVAAAVGDNSLISTILASVLGALMYFSTLTEVPIVEALMGSGMGKGPALALLLAGPALSLPNMLVIRTILGTQKTLVYCALVVVMATITGFIYGNWWV